MLFRWLNPKAMIKPLFVPPEYSVDAPTGEGEDHMSVKLFLISCVALKGLVVFDAIGLVLGFLIFDHAGTYIEI